jgi:hypothetical protein
MDDTNLVPFRLLLCYPEYNFFSIPIWCYKYEYFSLYKLSQTNDSLCYVNI